MYIKQIIIQGFKSYKDQTVIEPFSPRHNVIVGRNGSGKSNFFAAIRFVLSDAYTQMGREERQALLHEGSGSAVMSAYVEIIFDNSDERFPTGKDELILRRTIGQKKDEYSLDRKSATKADVMNLLESAGFSRSNPYYIVPQGRVTTLTNMKDPERLNLLKEVAGTQVYEARRTESLRIMAETDAKRAKIDELLTYIRERLDELEEEKEELQAYTEKDKERRCLEYTIYHREQEEITSHLEQLDEQRASGIDESDQNREHFVDGEKELARIDEEIKDLQQKMDLLRLDKQHHEGERRDATREKAKVELEIKTLSEGRSAQEAASARQAEDLKTVQNSISQREAELAELLPQYNEAKSQESRVKSELDNAEGGRQRLFGKMGRGSKFRSIEERDTWLNGEIEAINVALATRKAVIMETNEEIGQLNNDIKQAETEIADVRQTLDGHGNSMDSLSSEVQKAKEARDHLQDQRKELWREEARLDSVLRNTQQEMDRAERFLSQMMDHNTSRGIASVRRIAKQKGLGGVYGTLAELFTVNEKYRTAVEITAGNSLFHYVVDNEETATKVLEQLNEDKAGRVTFMPLNRLHPKSTKIPTADDAVEMMTRLKFDESFDAAMRQVFGKTVICPNLQIASQYARSHSINAITPDGDRSDKKGALTGGFHDPSRSRLEAVHNLAKWRMEYEKHFSRTNEIRTELQQKDQEITRAMSNVQKAEQKRSQSESGYAPLQQSLRSKVQEQQTKRDALEAKQRSKEKTEIATRDLSAQQKEYEKELQEEFKKELTSNERKELDNLSASIPDLRKRHAELSTNLSELEAQKSTIEVELKENLRPRLDQLQTQSQSPDSNTTSSNSKHKEAQASLKRINQAIETNNSKLQETESTIEEVQSSIAEEEKSRNERRTQQEELAKSIEKHQKRSEKSMAKRALLTEKSTEAARNIRDLGMLPEEAFSKKYSRIPSDQAIKRLRTVKEALKKYSHVNKKAFEQYSDFTQRREQLTKRREELDTSQSSIRELIEVLDQRKDEAIERTFKQVSKEFAQIFERLVPAGKGRLVIQRKTDKDRAREANGTEQEDGDASSDDENNNNNDNNAKTPTASVSNYTGISISVSFNSKQSEQQQIQQLSGGQKSLCALALILAIQQCDPAPFYLFDEIDANLDSQYRTAVAELLNGISSGKGSQFICTTFRAEMVRVAEKCYGVTFVGKSSGIGVVSREEALAFVEGEVGGS